MQLSRYLSGESSNSSRHSQLGAGTADLKNGDRIVYFSNFWQYLQLQQAWIWRMSTLRGYVGQLSCDWPVFYVISLLTFPQFLCVSTRYYIRTTVGSAISPHFLLYIMTVDFADRMTTAILRKNYRTVQQIHNPGLNPARILITWFNVG